MGTIQHTHKFYTPAEAERIAAAHTQEESAETDGWKYIAIHDPKGTGLSFVEVYDETDALVGRL